MKLRDRLIFVALIDSAGISERELARQAGLSHSTVNHLITGRRTSCSVETALAICEAFDCPVGVLFIVQRKDEEVAVERYEKLVGRRRSGPAAT